MRLDLHQRVRQLGMPAVMFGSQPRGNQRSAVPPSMIAELSEYATIVPCVIQLLGIADHVEERDVLRLAVDGPVPVENLVAAMLAVGLREHHQFDVGRIALELRERVDQVVDFVVREREAQFGVRRFQRAAAVAEDVDGLQRLGRQFVEQMQRVIARWRHAFGHAVVQRGGDGRACLRRDNAFLPPMPVPSKPLFSDDRKFDRRARSGAPA